MLLEGICDFRITSDPLVLKDVPRPKPSAGEVLLKVYVCGVCHTELDEIEGRTPPPRYPIIPGHQVVGRIVQQGGGSFQYPLQSRVGVAWIYSSCGRCHHCLSGNENLCDDFLATGRDAHGGYAEYITVKEDFVHPIPDCFTDTEAAPLLCAGAIGYRSLRLAVPSILISSKKRKGFEGNLGLTGFGASAHLVLKMIRFLAPHIPVFVFARNIQERTFAMELGASWAGDTTDSPPARMDAVIDTTPVWKPVVEAMKHLNPGGRLVINAIRKENHDKEYLLNLDYPIHLWMEKEIKSVANVTIRDVREFLVLAARIPVKPVVQPYPLEQANKALLELKQQNIRGAKVLVMKT
jgi:propanol-preferring alcohol dehydrogenase